MALDKLVDSTQLDSGLTSVANAIRAKSGGSSQLAFPAGFVSEIGNIPTGGGGSGVTKIASGTFTGAGSHSVTFPLGKKMPQYDFIVNVWVDGGTTITPTASTDRVVVILQAIYNKRFSRFDLSTDGTKAAVDQLSYPVVNGDTTTTRKPGASVNWASYVRQTTVVSESEAFKIIRDSSGFSGNIAKNSQYPFSNGITYNFEVLYFGSDPSNDIVEVP